MWFPHKEKTVNKYVGVDLHKKLIVICVVDQARRVLSSRRFLNVETERLSEWLESLGVASAAGVPGPTAPIRHPSAVSRRAR